MTSFCVCLCSFRNFVGWMVMVVLHVLAQEVTFHYDASKHQITIVRMLVDLSAWGRLWAKVRKTLCMLGCWSFSNFLLEEKTAIRSYLIGYVNFFSSWNFCGAGTFSEYSLGLKKNGCFFLLAESRCIRFTATLTILSSLYFWLKYNMRMRRCAWHPVVIFVFCFLFW